VVFVFASVNVVYYIYRFAYVEPPLHSWDEAYLVVVDIDVYEFMLKDAFPKKYLRDTSLVDLYPIWHTYTGQHQQKGIILKVHLHYGES
jgi:hypothetical protein